MRIALEGKRGTHLPLGKGLGEGLLVLGLVGVGGPVGGRARVGRGGRTRRGRGGTGTRGGQGGRAGTEGEQVRPNVGYATPDNGNVLPPFTPSRPPGTHFDRVIMRGAMTTELEFFHLFITTEMIAAVASPPNSYAHAKVGTQGYTRN